MTPSRSFASAQAALGVVCLGTALNPLNTTMIAVALSPLQHEFAIGAAASTRLFSAFALSSALGHPFAGHLADTFGARRVFVTGLVITGLSGLAAACATTFALLVAFRTLQAFGTSTAFPAGLALLQNLSNNAGGRRPLPAAWLGAVAVWGNVSAMLGPALGGLLVAAGGWRAIFLVNVPISAAGSLLALRYLPADQRRKGPRRLVPEFRPLVTNRLLLSVYARFAAVCTVFFAVFFGLPLWLQKVRELNAPTAGVMMLPMAGVAAFAIPLAAQTMSRSGIPLALVLGAGGLVVGTGVLATIGAETPIVGVLAAVVLIGVAHAFNSLGLQASLSDAALPDHLGRAAGLFQTARFVGAAVAATLVGWMFARGITTGGLQCLAAAVGLLSFTLFGMAVRVAVAPRTEGLEP